MERRRFNKPPKSVNGKDGTSYTQHSLDEILTPQQPPQEIKPVNIIPFNQKPNTLENRDNTPHSTGWVTDKWG
jgi:hypothetical protein